MLHEDELALLLRVCRDHEVAYCASCHQTYKLFDLTSDLIAGNRFNRCPSCGSSFGIEDSLRGHLLYCPVVWAEVVAGRADVIIKTSLGRVDRSRLRIAESQERTQRTRERDLTGGTPDQEQSPPSPPATPEPGGEPG